MSLVRRALTSTVSTPGVTPGARDDWQTPAWLFGALDLEFRFTLDAAATEETAMVRNSFLGPEEDGLRCSWGGRGSTVWLNPPYGRAVGEWVAKARQESERGAVVVVLIFSRTDTAWWHDVVMAHADEVRLIRGRLHFVRADGHTGPCTKGCALVVFRGESGTPPKFSAMTRSHASL